MESVLLPFEYGYWWWGFFWVSNLNLQVFIFGARVAPLTVETTLRNGQEAISYLDDIVYSYAEYYL